MGDFIFSRTFNMLSRQEWHHIILLMQRALSLLGPLSPVPWFIHIAFKLFPRVWILKDWFRMVAWCEEQMLQRLEVSVATAIYPNSTRIELTHCFKVSQGYLQRPRCRPLPPSRCTRRPSAVPMAYWRQHPCHRGWQRAHGSRSCGVVL